jgi:hypothetical protein
MGFDVQNNMIYRGLVKKSIYFFGYLEIKNCALALQCNSKLIH